MKWIFFAIGFFQASGDAQVFTCETNGKVIYSDRACELQKTTPAKYKILNKSDKTSSETAIDILKKDLFSMFAYEFKTASSTLYAPIVENHISISSDKYRISIEPDENNHVSFISITFLGSGPCTFGEATDVSGFLKEFSVNQADLVSSNTSTTHGSFYNHKQRLKYSVLCPYTGGDFQLGVSRKYYLN